MKMFFSYFFLLMIMISRIILNEGLGDGATPMTKRIINCFHFGKSHIAFLIFLICYNVVLFSVFLCSFFLDTFTNCLLWFILTQKSLNLVLFTFIFNIKKKKKKERSFDSGLQARLFQNLVSVWVLFCKHTWF